MSRESEPKHHLKCGDTTGLLGINLTTRMQNQCTVVLAPSQDK